MKGYTPSKRRRRSPLADTQELWLFAPCASNRFGALTHFSLIFSVWAHPKLAAKANNLKPRGRVKQRLRQLERRKKRTFGGSWVNYIVQSTAAELLTKYRSKHQ